MLPVAIIGSAVSAITNLIDNLHTSDKEKLDAEALWVILTGMLGLAGARTFEKIKGAAQ